MFEPLKFYCKYPRQCFYHSFIYIRSFSSFLAVDGIEMVFRGCSLESLDSQCGDFKFEDVRYKGCVTSCEEKGCNTANSFHCHICSHLTVVILFSGLLRMILIGKIL